jgi:50S ribosomal subunit-associated GTPase HflX
MVLDAELSPSQMRNLEDVTGISVCDREAVIFKCFYEACQNTKGKIKKTDTTQRVKRSSCKQITLIGYTNAGKASLMNALAGVNLSAKDKPFGTLNSTTRCLSNHGGDVLLSDTVGFIRELERCTPNRGKQKEEHGTSQPRQSGKNQSRQN